MRLVLVIALMLGLAGCASVSFEQERDGGIGGTGIESEAAM